MSLYQISVHFSGHGRKPDQISNGLKQLLYGLVQMIAAWWPDGELRQRYQTAALNFRVPYWDFAARPPPGESVLPVAIGGSSYVDVDGPNGRQRIANPLFNLRI